MNLLPFLFLVLRYGFCVLGEYFFLETQHSKPNSHPQIIPTPLLNRQFDVLRLGESSFQRLLH